MTKKVGISLEAQEAADRMIMLVRNEKIKKHILGNSAIDKHGTLEELELQQYSEFIRTRIAYDFLQMVGSEING